MAKEKDVSISKKDQEFLASLNADVIFNHKSKGKDGYMSCLGVKERDIKKFIVDLMEDAGDKISEAMEYIWKSDNTLEFKICCLFWFGRHVGHAESGGGGDMGDILKKAIRVSGSELKDILRMIEKREQDED